MTDTTHSAVEAVARAIVAIADDRDRQATEASFKVSHSAILVPYALFDRLRAALAAMPSQAPGWRMVPVEPTPEMIWSGDSAGDYQVYGVGAGDWEAEGRFSCHGSKAIWSAMIAAAPAIPEEGWRPIAEAPRDGTCLLFWCSRDVEHGYDTPEQAKRFCIGYYGEDNWGHPRWLSITTKEEMWGMGSEYTLPMYETENIECFPTHFRPLPAPPLESDDAG